jgi:hypothetical protein
MIIGTPGEIRTPDQLVRSQLLYPAELRAHDGKWIIYTVRDYVTTLGKLVRCE